MDQKSTRVLLIEDNPGDARLVKEALAEAGAQAFSLDWVPDLAGGLAHLAGNCTDAILLDLALPDSNGFNTFARVHTQAPQIPTILLTGLDDDTLASQAVRAGAQEYLVKSEINGRLLGRMIRYAIERKRTEETLKNTLADLERSNMDLEQFAYVASHDLQEPLRMVSSYTQLLAQRYKGKLDKDADEFIDYATGGANTMQRLINDLLSYSRVGNRSKSLEPTPSDAALDRALENLKLAIEESKAEVNREPLPTVTADDVQLIQVFQNLIANAIKFRGNESPRILVACHPRGTEWVFSVRDNGIGIDPQYLERIFIIFQRLHPRGKYPGTGIGLAICKKIIQRHGGRIWAESKPGEGSTFFFTLPVVGGH